MLIRRGSMHTRIPCRALPGRGGVSQRRRGWDARQPARSSRGTSSTTHFERMKRCGRCNSFSFPADATVPGIFNQYTTISELLADAVGSSKVAALARIFAFGKLCFDFTVRKLAALVVIAELVQFFRIVVLEHRENAVERRQESLHGGNVAMTKFAFVDGDICFAD